MKLTPSALLAVAVAVAVAPGWAPPSRAQVRFAAPENAAEHAGASVDALADFLRERAGVELTQPIKSRLAEMEGRVRSGAARRLAAGELADVLTETAWQRLSTLTDEEIEKAARACRADRSYVGLTWGAVDATPQVCAQVLRRLRAQSRQADGPAYEAVRGAALGRGGAGGVKGHLKLYESLLSEQFGSALTEGLTPVQAVLVTYAVASDDPIHWPLTRLRAEMEHAHQWRGGDEFPDPAGRVAFGPEGYLFPTPLDLIFNEGTLDALLDRIGERTKK